MSDPRVAAVGTLIQGQTVESLLHAGIAQARMGASRRPRYRSSPRLAPCKCNEGIIRVKDELTICPECNGSRVVEVIPKTRKECM